MFQVEFPPEQPWFEHFRLRVDLGFLGIEKDYVCKEILIPHKKPRKQEFTPAQTAENKGLASQRIVVEHAHAGLKRYRILADRLRMHNFMLYDVVLGVCAGLWNFYLSC
jgi:DDE superfamily endonuclease